MPVPRRWLPRALALAVVAGGAFAAGCGGSEEGARPASEGTPAQEQSEADKAREDDGTGQSSSITQRSDGSGSSQSSSIRQSGGSSSSSSSQTSSGGSGVSTFSGNGQTTLSFNAERPSRLVWTNNQGERFTIKGGGISADSREGRGEVRLDPGKYENLHVDGENWTIVVRPR